MKPVVAAIVRGAIAAMVISAGVAGGLWLSAKLSQGT